MGQEGDPPVKLMLGMVEALRKVRLPFSMPWQDIWNKHNAEEWRNVDTIILHALDRIKEAGCKTPLHTLSLHLVQWSFDDSDPLVQTIAWRALDTRLLVDERRRIGVIMESDEPWNLTPPEHPWQIPPSLGRSFYGTNGARDGVKLIREELIERGIMKREDQDGARRRR